MKILITVLFLSVFVFGQNSELDNFSKMNPCDVLSNTYLVESMNWTKELIKKNEEKFRRSSVCTINHDEENMLVRLGWKSEKAVNNEVLAKQFAGFLSKGEKGIKYEEISNKDGIQVLYGKGQEKFGFITYIARKRFGNKKAIQIEIRSKSRDEESSRKLALEMIERVK